VLVYHACTFKLVEDSMRKEHEAEKQRYMDEYMDEIKKPQAEASDEITEPQAESSETFGDIDSHEKISASHLRLCRLNSFVQW
jgi:hypothetical protein